MKHADELIAITGYGSVSPLGVDSKEIWDAYLSEEHCFVKKQFNNKEYPVATLSNSAESCINQLLALDNKYKRMDRSVLMAITAAEKAFKQAGWHKASDKKQIGINIGSSRGATGLFEKFHEEFITSKELRTALLTSPLTTLGNISSEVAAHLVTNGPVISNSTTCSTAFQSIGNAIAWLKAGMSDLFIAGGSEAPLTKFTLAQTEALGIYTRNINDKYPCRPLSDETDLKNTFALGEGAAIFAIEKIKKEDVGNKNIYALIESVGFAFEQPPSATGLAEDGSLLYKSMKNALSCMQTSRQVDLLLMHGTGTVKGDRAEMNAINKVFENNQPDLYSNKWKIGHTYAASAALNLELALLILKHNTCLNLPYPNIINNKKTDIKKIMINATGFGGNATTLIVSCPSVISD